MSMRPVEAIKDAVDKGDSEEAIRLLESNPELINSPMTQLPGYEHVSRDRIIHATAQSVKACRVLSWLLDKGVSPDTPGHNKWTPLHCAAWIGNVEGIRELVRRGADVEARNESGVTPLDLTYNAWTPESFDILLSLGAKPSLFIAIAMNRMDIVERLLSTCSPDELRDRVLDRELLQSFSEEEPHANRKMRILTDLQLKPKLGR